MQQTFQGRIQNDPVRQEIRRKVQIHNSEIRNRIQQQQQSQQGNTTSFEEQQPLRKQTTAD